MLQLCTNFGGRSSEIDGKVQQPSEENTYLNMGVSGLYPEFISTFSMPITKVGDLIRLPDENLFLTMSLVQGGSSPTCCKCA